MKHSLFVKWIAFGLTVVVPVVHCHAVQSSTEVATAMVALDRAEDAIDENSTEVAEADAAADLMNERIQKKTERWNRILNARIPQVQKKLTRHYQKMSDSEVLAEAASVAQDKSWNDAAEARAFLIQDSSEKVVTFMPKLANGIGKAGGLFKYIRHLKEMRKLAKEKLEQAQAKKKMDRSPAANEKKCWEEYLFFGGLALLVLGVIFAIILPVGATISIVGGGIAFTGFVFMAIRASNEEFYQPSCEGLFI